MTLQKVFPGFPGEYVRHGCARDPEPRSNFWMWNAASRQPENTLSVAFTKDCSSVAFSGDRIAVPALILRVVEVGRPANVGSDVVVLVPIAVCNDVLRRRRRAMKRLTNHAVDRARTFAASVAKIDLKVPAPPVGPQESQRERSMAVFGATNAAEVADFVRPALDGAPLFNHFGLPRAHSPSYHGIGGSA